MLPERLHIGDTIGLASPSWLATPERFAPIIEEMQKMGFRVKCADNLYANGWGYAASDTERADDLNQLIRDPEVKLIFFSGGEGADDVLPLLDYEAAKANSKLWLSYSDGTSILNTIWSRTGLITCYGQMPGVVIDESEYDRLQFQNHILSLPTEHVPSSDWHLLTKGQASGTLIGGYITNFLFLIGSGRIPLDRDYVLFLEDHEQFCGVERESDYLAQLEQSGIKPHVKGLLFGHFSDPVNPWLLKRLQLLGERWKIPVAYCDDYGHGKNHAILQLGAQATLDTAKGTLVYHW